VVNDKTSAPTFKKRAQIILALDTNVGEPATQAEIARRVGVSAPTIFNTIKAFSEEGLEAILHFKTPMEPNRRRIVTGEIEARIIAIACGAPPEGFGRWTVRSLTNKTSQDSSFPRRRESRKIKELDSRLRGNDDLFSVSLID
jgi:transposase